MFSLRNIALISIIMTGILSGCTRSPSGTPPATAKNPLIYPGATQVTTTTNTTDPGAINFQKTALFHTTDSVSNVMNFYKDALQKDGWELNKNVTPEVGRLDFFWNDGCPMSSIRLYAETLTDGNTEVNVELGSYGCE